MTSHSGVLPAHGAAAPALRALMTILVFAAACLASIGIALLNQPWFDFVNGFARAQGADLRGILFSSWLVLLSVPIVVWHPAAFGFTFGSIREHWRLVTGALIAAALGTAALLTASGPIPYSDASPFIEIVDVPVTEELAFRAVLLTALLWTLRWWHPARTAAILAVAFNGVAFGLAHMANATDLALGFVVGQAAVAIVVGIACAGLMVRTRSVYPAILFHAVVNAVVVFI